jgi:hypothetical protein
MPPGDLLPTSSLSHWISWHGYKNHPGVLSDIAILVRQNLKPGDAERPLVHQQINFWTLPEDYP